MREKIEVDSFDYKEKDFNRRNLKRMREIYGATQDEIAEALNVSRVSVSNWENGVGGMISRSNLEKLCNLYGLEVDYFFDRELDEHATDTIIENKNVQLLPTPVEKPQRTFPPIHKNNETKKEEAFQSLLKKYTFQDAMTNYLSAVKLIIGLSIDCSEEEAELALQIEEQMGRRLRTALLQRQEDIREGNKVEVLYSQLENCRETRLF
jgi:transcriptional regulator with XRE-family HTH domain